MESNGENAAQALERLRIAGDLYCAGLPKFPSNFTRDGFYFSLIAQDMEVLQGQISYCSELQGRNIDSITGEEPGKIHHEHPGEKFRNLITTYNACDSTALYLLGVCALVKNQENVDALKLHLVAIQDAITYITSHLKDFVFVEDPALADAKEFALRVTYWKDSVINAPGEKTHYPIAFALAHFQNALALNQAGLIMHDSDLVETSIKMYEKGLEAFWRTNHFVTAIDGHGNIVDPISSDSLHSLVFIPPKYLPDGYARLIEEYSSALETDAGYRTGIPHPDITDHYHTDYVWTHEQAILHCGARQHGLAHAQEVSERVVKHCTNGFPELIDVDNFLPAGNPTQLWSIGASLYFDNIDEVPNNPFLSI